MQWREAAPIFDQERFPGMDPFANWILGSGFEDFSRGDNPTLIPCTIGPLDAPMAQLLKDFQDPVMRALLRQKGIFIPWLYLQVGIDDYAVAFVEKGIFDSLAHGEGPLKGLIGHPVQVDLGLPLKLKSLPLEWKSEQKVFPPDDPPVADPGAWPSGTVVVGIIDDGIAFAHERFRLGGGKTRVQYFWQQDGTHSGPGSTVSYGNETCKLGPNGIDELLRRNGRTGQVDEDRLYREAGLADFGDGDHKAVAWRIAHGTHILGHAAGEDPGINRDDRPIIAVQLPVSVTADTSGSNLKPYALDAINYIIDRADRLAGKGGPPGTTFTPLPVVINFSYGMIAGPHDGTLDLEQAIDKLTQSRAAPVRVVLPAGNANLSRCHSKLALTRNESKSLYWRVQPDDLTPTFMEIWMPYERGGKPAGSRVAITISTPSGLSSTELKEGAANGIQLVENGEVIASAFYSYRPRPTERGMFAIALAPSARLGNEPGSAAGRVPSGRWTITVKDTGLQDGQEVNAWIQWDDVIYGYRSGGRQSYFEADCYVRFDPISGDEIDTDDPARPCHIQRAGTVNAIATGREAIVIGGVQQADLRPPKYTASGPTTPTRDDPPHREGPDAACVSDDSRIHSGIFGPGSHSGSTVLLSGTSVAVPQVVRLVADMLGMKGPGDRDAVQAFAQAQEGGPFAPGARAAMAPPLDMKRSGAGRMVRPRPNLPRDIA